MTLLDLQTKILQNSPSSCPGSSQMNLTLQVRPRVFLSQFYSFSANCLFYSAWKYQKVFFFFKDHLVPLFIS